MAPPLTGYDLALQVFERGGVEALIELAGGAETEWLEFKAGFGTPDASRSENHDDCHWHVSRSLIAMANGRGGALLLGVNNGGAAVGIEGAEPAEVEQTLLKIRAKACPRGGWNTSRRRLRLDDARLESCVIPRRGEHQGKTIAVLLVMPVQERPLLVTQTAAGAEFQLLLLRARGDFGEATPYTLIDDIRRKWEARLESLEQHDLSMLWDRFQGQPAGAPPAGERVGLAGVAAALGITLPPDPVGQGDAVSRGLRAAVEAGALARLERAWSAAAAEPGCGTRETRHLRALVASAGAAAAACQDPFSGAVLETWWLRGGALWSGEAPAASAGPALTGPTSQARLAAAALRHPSAPMTFWTAWWLLEEDHPSTGFLVRVPFTFSTPKGEMGIARLVLVPCHGPAGCVFEHPSAALEPLPQSLEQALRETAARAPCCAWRLEAEREALPPRATSDVLELVAGAAFRLLQRGQRFRSHTLLHASAVSARRLRPAPEEERALELCGPHGIRQLGVAHGTRLSAPSGALTISTLNDVADAERLATLCDDDYRLGKQFVPRPSELEPIIGLLLEGGPREDTPPACVVRGMGGLGKTTIAKAVLNDPRVQDAFDDNLAFVTAGTEADVSNMLRSAAEHFGAPLPAGLSLEESRKHLERALFDKKALIVIDDVWKPDVLRAFRLDAPRCRLLITSRIEGIADVLGPFRVHQLRLPEEGVARSILARAVGVEAGALPSEAAGVVEECGRLPLALALVGSTIRGWTSTMSAPSAWRQAAQALRSADLTPFEKQLPDYHLGLQRAMALSVDALEEESRKAYLDCAVFPDGAVIPLAVPGLWWNRSEDELDALVHGWVESSLAAVLSSRRITIHDMLRKYLRVRRGAEMAGLHRGLAAAYLAASNQRPAEGPNSGVYFNYFFRWLVFHMHAAGDREEIRKLCFDASWIQAKLERLDPASVMADYALLEGNPDARLVLEALRLSEDALRCDAAAVGGQLTGRLAGLGGKDVKLLLNNFAEAKDGSRLLPIGRCLKSPEGPAAGVGMWQAVAGWARSLFGRKIVTRSPDGQLERWKAGAQDIHGQPALALLPEGGALFRGEGNQVILRETGRTVLGETATRPLSASVRRGSPLVVIVTEGGGLAEFDLRTRKKHYEFPAGEARATAVSISSDKVSYAVANEDGEVRRYVVGTWARGETVAKFSSPVTALIELETDGSFVSGHQDGIVRKWRGGAESPDWETEDLGGPVTQVVEGGGFLLTSASGRELRLWFAESGYPAGVFLADSPVTRCSISAQGRQVAFRDAEGRLGVLAVRTPAPAKRAVSVEPADTSEEDEEERPRTIRIPIGLIAIVVMVLLAILREC